MPDEAFSGKGQYEEQGWQLDRTDIIFQHGSPSKLKVHRDNYLAILEHAPALFREGSPLEELDVQGVCGFTAALTRTLEAHTKKQLKARKDVPTYRPLARVILENYYRLPDLAIVPGYEDNIRANIDDLKALAKHPIFSHMTSLSYNNLIANNTAYDNAEKALLCGAHMEHVRHLRIESGVYPSRLSALLKSPLRKLHSLQILMESGNAFHQIDKAAIKELGILSNLPNVSEIKNLSLKAFIPVPTIEGDKKTKLCDQFITLFLNFMPKLNHIELSLSMFVGCSTQMQQHILKQVPYITLHNGLDLKMDSANAVMGSIISLKRALEQEGTGKLAQHIKFTGQSPLSPTQLREILSCLNEKTTVEAHWKPDDKELSKQLQRNLENRNNPDELKIGI